MGSCQLPARGYRGEGVRASWGLWPQICCFSAAFLPSPQASYFSR